MILNRCGCTLLSMSTAHIQQKRLNRFFWGWLNYVWNRVDPERIESVGPDRAAAEWLLRCGAAVKWKNAGSFLTDYNSLPNDDLTRYKIEEIDGTDSTIMHYGFAYLKGLEHLRKIVIDNNIYLDDQSLYFLSYVKDRLEHLELIRCPLITDYGINGLNSLKNLKYLKLFDLPAVEQRETCLNKLKDELKNCKIEWPLAKGG